MRGDLEIKVVAKVRGVWKLALLTFLMRHKSAHHVVHVHLNDGSKVVCLTHATEKKATTATEKPPSLTGQ